MNALRVLLLACVGLLVAAAPAAAASIQVSPTSVPPGGSVKVSGSVAGGCSPGGQVTLTSTAFASGSEFAGVPAVFTPSTNSGSFSARAQIASATAPGSYTVDGRCGGGNFGSAGFTVTTASGGALPRTGGDPAPLALSGIGVLLLGAALRRRLRAAG
jgi:hypothetical protein